MGKLLALLIVLLTVASVWTFVSGNWWFVPQISEHGAALDSQFERTAWVVAFAFVSSQFALAYAIVKYGRKGNERAVYSHGNNKLEWIWTIVTAGIFIAVAILGQLVWYRIHLEPIPANAAPVDVVAQQFQWNFHYPGADGIMGQTNAQYINDGSLNFVGLDPNDANAKDDIQISTLIVPKGRPVALQLRSKDVIHSFWVPVFRIKQDAVPGMNVRLHFTANHVGKYEMTCVELCGSLHYNMKTFALVVEQNEYDEMMAMDESKFKDKLNQLIQRYEVNSDKIVAQATPAN
jgi:cytochrome c oxidase subunit II